MAKPKSYAEFVARMRRYRDHAEDLPPVVYAVVHHGKFTAVSVDGIGDIVRALKNCHEFREQNLRPVIKAAIDIA